MSKIYEDNGRSISMLNWQNVRDQVFSVNKELASIIDAIDPSSAYKLIEVEYKYGDLFIENSEIQLPHTDGGLISILDDRVPKKIKDELYYATMPFFLMLDKDNEVFINTGRRVIPINLFHKGNMSGVYETMDFMMGSKSEPIWNFSAGARSICMLPKITNKQGLQRLFTTFGVPATTQISSLSDHWELLKMMAQSPTFQQPWKSKILYFGSKWITNNHTDKNWQKFKKYLLKEIWRQASFSINKFKFNLYWEKFAETISLRRLQPRPYLIDQVKHILSIMIGDFPGFIPAGTQQEAAPITGLQEAFLDVYALKNYFPTIMHSCLLTDIVHKPSHVYYSLSLPTVLEGSPIDKSSATIVSDMRQIKLIIDTLKNYTHSDIKLIGHQAIQKGEVNYFHRDEDKCKEINHSINIVNDDTSFLMANKNFPQKDFCYTSPFFSGCIRITNPDNQ